MTTDIGATEHSRLTRLISFLQQDPSNLTLLLDAMALAIETGNTAAGQQLIAHIKAHAIDDPQICAQAAHLLLQAGEYAAAGEYGDKAIEGGLTHSAVIFNTAFGHFYSGEYARTSALLTHLTASAECTATTLIIHARALHHQELSEEAESLMRRAQQQEPHNIEARGLLALLQYENDDNASALQTAHETLADDPDQLDALLACADVHLEEGRIEASRKTWLHTVSAHPTCGRAWSGLAHTEFNELEFDLAEEHLQTAVQFMPDHIGTWHLLAWIYILRNDSPNARKALDKSYVLDHNAAESHGSLAVVDVMDGLDDQARLRIRRALKLNPDCRAACIAEMLLLQKAGKPAEAAQVLNEMLARAAPNDSQNTGHVLLEQWLRQHPNMLAQTPSGQN